MSRCVCVPNGFIVLSLRSTTKATKVLVAASAAAAAVVIVAVASAINRSESHNNTIINHSMHMRME